MMNACRLDNSFLLNAHKSRTDALDKFTIAKKFVSADNRQENYFGKLQLCTKNTLILATITLAVMYFNFTLATVFMAIACV